MNHCDCGLAKWWGQQEFAIPQNVLEIVYGQTICWIGTFYCPLLPAINTVKYILVFYLKKVTAQHLPQCSLEGKMRVMKMSQCQKYEWF